MQIFIDFDGVLFDSGSFYDPLLCVFERSGYSRSETERQIHDVAGRHKKNFGIASYSFSAHQEMYLLDRHQSIFQDLCELMKTSSAYVYEDSRKFLESLRPHATTILTTGDPELQEKKVVSSGLELFVDAVEITHKPKYHTIERYREKFPNQRIVFVEDKIEQLRETLSITGVHRVLIQRPNARYVAQSFEGADLVCEDLTKAKKYIHSLIT
jgi:FMN phosphatase YigB (HAD superfamily)